MSEDFSKVPEAITRKPLTQPTCNCQIRLQGMKEPHRQRNTKIEEVPCRSFDDWCWISPASCFTTSKTTIPTPVVMVVTVTMVVMVEFLFHQTYPGNIPDLESYPGRISNFQSNLPPLLFHQTVKNRTYSAKNTIRTKQIILCVLFRSFENNHW